MIFFSKLYSKLSANNVPLFPSENFEFPKVFNFWIVLLYIILSAAICLPSWFFATTLPVASTTELSWEYVNLSAEKL